VRAIECKRFAGLVRLSFSLCKYVIQLLTGDVRHWRNEMEIAFNQEIYGDGSDTSTTFSKGSDVLWRGSWEVRKCRPRRVF
jgi:hypothetical protein